MEQTKVNAAAESGLTKYTIIEDCSPYYVRFMHTGIEEVNTIFQQHLKTIQLPSGRLETKELSEFRSTGWNPLKLDDVIKSQLKDKIPFWNKFNFGFGIYGISTPGFRFPIHKDTKSDLVGINYLIETHDDRCVTNFYSEESVANLPQSPLNSYHQGATIDKDADRPLPVKSVIFKAGEAILFNPSIWHDWDNSTGAGRRVNVLLRGIEGYPSFEETRKTLFGY